MSYTNELTCHSKLVVLIQSRTIMPLILVIHIPWHVLIVWLDWYFIWEEKSFFFLKRMSCKFKSWRGKGKVKRKQELYHTSVNCLKDKLVEREGEGEARVITWAWIVERQNSSEGTARGREREEVYNTGVNDWYSGGKYIFDKFDNY